MTDAATGDAVLSGSLDYVAASSGDYRAKVESTSLTGLVGGRRYRITATASQDGYDGTWNLTLPARDRGRN
jgi:hypothetical protein